jgi:hypothetical protein
MPLEKVVAQSQYMDIKPQQSGERNSERDDWTSHWTFDGAYWADQQSNWLRPGNEGIPPWTGSRNSRRVAVRPCIRGAPLRKRLTPTTIGLIYCSREAGYLLPTAYRGFNNGHQSALFARASPIRFLVLILRPCHLMDSALLQDCSGYASSDVPAEPSVTSRLYLALK